MKNSILITTIILFGSIANALDLTNNFNFEGVLLDSSSVPIITTVSITFQIYDPSVTCLLFEETQSSVTPDSTGYFSVKIGTGIRNSGADGGVLWRNIFQNDSLVRAPGSNCASGYTPASADGRRLRITVGGTVLSPDFAMSAVPMATVAESLQGKTPSDFIQSSNVATGDLTGFNSAPIVAKIQGNAVSATAPSANQVLAWSGSSWDPVTLPGPSGSAGGDLSGTYPNPTVAKIQGYDVSATAPSVNQVLAWSGSSWAPVNSPPDSTKLPLAGGTMSGDISMGSNKITNLSDPVASQGAATKNYVDTIASSITASGSAGGDLSGTYPNPTVASIANYPVDLSMSPTTDDILQWNGTKWTSNYLDDVTKVSKAGDTISGSLTTTFGGSPANNAISFNGPSHGIYSPGPGNIGFSTMGTERIRITNGGNIGIGTTSPGAMLDVSGSVKIGPGGSSPLTGVYFYANISCNPGASIAAASAGNCVASSITQASVGGPQSVTCTPTSTPSLTNMVHSCYVSGPGLVTIVVANHGGGTLTAPTNWNIAITNY